MSKTYREMADAFGIKPSEDQKVICADCGTDHSTAYMRQTCADLRSVLTDFSAENGGSTSYYKLDPSWTDLQDIIEAHHLNYAQANILKVAYTINVGRHSGTDYVRDLNKLIWFANRELALHKKHKGNQ